MPGPGTCAEGAWTTCLAGLAAGVGQHSEWLWPEGWLQGQCEAALLFLYSRKNMTNPNSKTGLFCWSSFCGSQLFLYKNHVSLVGSFLSAQTQPNAVSEPK